MNSIYSIYDASILALLIFVWL